MECDYTHLHHDLLVSQKKSDHQGSDYKGALLYPSYCPHLSTLPSFIYSFGGWCDSISPNVQNSN
jgi:hypothetical protein